MSAWKQVAAPLEHERAWARMFGAEPLVPAPTVHTNGTVEAFVGREPVGPDQVHLEDLRWHISVRGPGRVPRWSELVDAAHALRPGVVFCVPMPPRTWWLNVHEHVLHLWELRDPNLEEQWRAEASGHAPS